MRNVQKLIRNKTQGAVLGTVCWLIPAIGIPTWSFGQVTEVTYTVVPAQSVLAASGTFNGTPLMPQQVFGPGIPAIIYESLTDSYVGTITADRDATANTIQITGGIISAQDNGPFVPSFNNSVVADYGVENGGPPQLATEFLGAVSDFSFSPTSPAIAVATGFDASQLFSTISSGELNYSFLAIPNDILSEFDSSTPIGGTLMFASGAVSLADAAGIETLTIPVTTDFFIDVTNPGVSSEPLPLDLELSGSIVATTVVPEPTSLSLLALSGLLLLRNRQFSNIHEGDIRARCRLLAV